MIVRCLGEWTENFTHAPATIGVKEPLADAGTASGACDLCCKAMGVQITCRWCEKAQTGPGICLPCFKLLSTKMGEPTIELTVFRAGTAGPIAGSYDGSGAMLRLASAMRQDNYLGFALRAMAGVGG